MRFLIDDLSSRTIGAVEDVSTDRIRILLDPDAPHSMALNTGNPSGFPKINGYVLMPNEVGATVGWICSIRVERVDYPKRRGMKDFGLIDLPFPSRVITIVPMGTLGYHKRAQAEIGIELRRGVDVFPSVGDSVLLPTATELRAIVEGESEEGAGRVLLGEAPTAGGAPVYVNPDKIFGRHLAVLGNTGAGKSCTVAGLIRWSLESAAHSRKSSEKENESPNARFIVLDPNGEYARAFDEFDIRLFQVDPKETRARPLKVPSWLWNGEEWAGFSGAAPGVQRPILFESLRQLRAGAEGPNPFASRIRSRVSRYRNRIRVLMGKGDHQAPGKREGVAKVLQNMSMDFDGLAEDEFCEEDDLREKLENVSRISDEVESGARSAPKDGGYWHDDFAEVELERIIEALNIVAEEAGMDDADVRYTEDTPKYFPMEELPNYVDALASDTSGRDLAQFVDSLNLRIEGLMGRGMLAPILNPEDSARISLEGWLEDYIGSDEASHGPIAVIDLSLVPSEVVHIVVAVLARMTFEALQRYRRETGHNLPTVLVLEEAHTFVHRELTQEGARAAGRTCCATFERIAREGRKFGLGLVLASQRPSEVSQTVLSQCNTFLLHRIVNDRDQDLVKRLVPDSIAGLLSELPSLPSRRGILLGWAVPAPVLVEIRELPESQRPHSPDPDFWKVWTGDTEDGERQIDWEIIAEPWASPSAQEEAGNTPDGDIADSDVLGSDT